MSYDRIVAAALAETNSKFRLAEALALDIPPREAGRPAANGAAEPIGRYLDAARQAIIEAGGEPRSAETLRRYRLTALWVQQNRVGTHPIFRWVTGASFSAHDEARATGVSYDDFVANPRGVDVLRREAGVAPSHGQPKDIARGWSPEEKAEAAREILSDPDVADEVMLEEGPHRENAIVAVGRAHGREDLERTRPEPRSRDMRDDSGDLARATIAFRKVSRDLIELATLLQSMDIHHKNADVREGFRALVTGIDNRLDIVKGIVEGRSMDDELQDLAS